MRRDRAAESGFSIVVLLASITVMLILMGAAVPTWRYVMKNDREEELYFRGDQIARAVERYQRKNGNALPISMELLVKGHYLRKMYKDPMTKNGQWRLIHPGEGLLPGGGGPGMPGAPGTAGGPGGSRLNARGGMAAGGGAQGGFPGMPMAGRPGGGRGAIQGPILGVASTSSDKSLKLMNGRSRYDQWLFLAGQPRLLGGDQSLQVRPGRIGPSPLTPGLSTPLPGPQPQS